MDEHVSLYVSPINLDPEQPAMPISHPSYYAGYLARRHGPFATLGLAEDTWALNEGVTDDATFLQQAHDIDDERRTMCVTAIDQLRRGALVCVFDATDRIQHMFWRYLDAAHPAHRADVPDPHKHAIRDLYEKNDRLVGDVLGRLQPDDVLMVLSDHGFSAFRRGVNLNAWLLREGYLALRPGHDGTAEWLRDVDWSRTRAYCVGLGGMYLNLRGREQDGVVAPGAEAAALKAEIIGKLHGLRDAERAEIGVREAFDTAALYSGPYLENAPDLIIGYNAGYRASWDGATGVVAGPVFEDNTKAWSGDHCIDPRLVPGVLFCNRPVTAEGDLVDRGRRPDRAHAVRARAAGLHGGAGLGRGVMTGPARRWLAVLAAVVALAAACGPRHTPTGRRVIVLGIDGLDYHLVRDLIGQGRLPHLARLGEGGRFTPLATTTPPLSPVAWSTFLTGLDPGGARHLRLHPPPSRDDRVVPVDLAHRAAGTHADARPLAVPAGRRPRRAAAPRDAVLGGARGPRHRNHHRPHAGQLSALGHRHPRAERHGHARHARHLRHLHAVHVAARGLRAAERVGRHHHADRRHRRRGPRRRSRGRRTRTWSRRRRRRWPSRPTSIRRSRRCRSCSAASRRCCGSASGATGCRWSCRWRR